MFFFPDDFKKNNNSGAVRGIQPRKNRLPADSHGLESWTTQCGSAAMNHSWQESHQRAVFPATWTRMLEFWGPWFGKPELVPRWTRRSMERRGCCSLSRPSSLPQRNPKPLDGVTDDTLAPSRVSPSRKRERKRERGDGSFLGSHGAGRELQAISF